jgi:hypothetical protein
MSPIPDATTDVRINGRPVVFIDKDARIRIEVPITRADDPWTQLFDLAAAESRGWGWTNIFAVSDAIEIGTDRAALVGALDFVAKKIEEVNLTRKRLAEQANEIDAKVEEWWRSRGAQQ